MFGERGEGVLVRLGPNITLKSLKFYAGKSGDKMWDEALRDDTYKLHLTGEREGIQ